MQDRMLIKIIPESTQLPTESKCNIKKVNFAHSVQGSMLEMIFCIPYKCLVFQHTEMYRKN